MARPHYWQPEEPECCENPAFLYDTLYCSEENWEEEAIQDNYSQTHEEIRYTQLNHPVFPVLLEQDLSWEDDELSSLFAKEEPNQLYSILQADPSLAEARREAVEWMLKVNAYYSFTPLTAILAVDYLDRFLVTFQFQTEKPWTVQLAAVACLSVAAKVEEIQVPLLLDLQVESNKYFEAKTIQRMELLVLSTLQWRMNPITPISFLDYMTRRLRFRDYLCWEFLTRCERVLLSVISDCRSMRYMPSVMATAAMLRVINGVEPYLGAEYQNQLLGILSIDKDKVEDCSKLIMELGTGELSQSTTKRKLGSIPGSPNGVMDLSFSSDSSNDSWAMASSVSSSPEPLSKKIKALQSLSHSTPDLDLSRAFP